MLIVDIGCSIAWGKGVSEEALFAAGIAVTKTKKFNHRIESGTTRWDIGLIREKEK